MVKKFLSCALGALMLIAPLSSCALPGLGDGSSSSESSSSSSSSSSSPIPQKPAEKPLAKIEPTVYDVPEIVTAEQTKAGSVEAWLNQVNGAWPDRDFGTPNTVIHSPWHTLTINDVEVPVYTARCANGSHSFAWVDVTSNKRNFRLEVELTMSEDYGKCVVLPESREVEAEKDGNTFTSEISAFGSYTYTFAKSADAKVTDYKATPLTLMVAEEADFDIPDGYEVVEIKPGYHSEEELKFTQSDTVYIVKEGFHDISSIRIPEYSLLYIERGAYMKVTDRFVNGAWNTDTALNFPESHGTKVVSRGLLDCGSVLGGDNKRKHVVDSKRSTGFSIEGLTLVNANTWSMCFYDCEELTVERNMLFSFRTYSDGIMMSDCVDSVGRYNFVRTGDDSIEFKGTGWGSGTHTGSNCLYEYNDLWTDKGAGYCLTYENARDMSDMVFRNNSIGFAIPTWAKRNTAIDVLVGVNQNTRWGDVTFENIEIYHVVSPNAVQIHMDRGGAIIDNIVFKNITVKSTEEGVYAFCMFYDNKTTGDSISNIKIVNMNFCGKVLTSEDKSNSKLFCNEAPKFFGELTVK